MGIVEWARSPWGEDVPIHIAFYLIWVCAIAGLLFMIVHAVWARYFAPPDEYADSTPPEEAAHIPEKVARHSLAARMFHWVMALAMFGLLFTAFLPRVGVKFPWVTYHWIAGIVLTVSIVFHIIHATFFMDFWSIWPNKGDMAEVSRRLRSASSLPRRDAKYPLENKLYHAVIVLTGIAVTVTGAFMMSRVRTPFFTRNPYLFGDMTWGLMYVLHGLAGVGLIALVMVHVYFAVRPDKFEITKSMIFGSMNKEFYLKHYDPERWVPESPSSK